jgi:putative hydrolase of the HAD superfamily
MGDPPVLAWDVGGVLLSNGWDVVHRSEASVLFGFDAAAVEARHIAVQEAFERGQMTMDEYLDFTVFYEPRSFGRSEIREHIFACSTAHTDTLEFASRLAKTGRFRMVTLNNESIELNEHRIERFGLRRSFSAFFTSGYLGRRKPDPEIFAQVCSILHKPPEAIIFIDDRPENVAAAASFGMTALHYRDLPQLQRDLGSLGVVE